MEQKIKRGEMREVVREGPRESLSYKLVKNVARNKCCFYLSCFLGDSISISL